jgi:hypothetical protein
MGIFKNLLKAAGATQAQTVRKITFDPNWQDEMESLRLAIQGKNAPTSVSVEFPDALCDEICTAIETRKPSARIPYSDVKVPINNVGESYRQEEIANFCDSKTGEEMEWIAGLLMPEMLNPYDKTAVAVHAIKINRVVEENDEKFSIVQVGYLEKEVAKKVHKKILSLLGKDQYVPLLIRFTGGSADKPNYGAFPYVMTDKISFE